MAEQSFTKAKPIHRPLVQTLLGIFPTSRFSIRYDVPGQVIINYDGDWTPVLASVTAAVAAADEDTDTNRARDEIEGDKKFRALVLWVAQKHGLTPAQARAEIRVILAGL